MFDFKKGLATGPGEPSQHAQKCSSGGGVSSGVGNNNEGGSVLETDAKWSFGDRVFEKAVKDLKEKLVLEAKS